MSLKAHNEKIENSLSYMLKGKSAKRISHKGAKRLSNKLLRRKMKDIYFVPIVKQRNGWEW